MNVGTLTAQVVLLVRGFWFVCVTGQGGKGGTMPRGRTFALQVAS